MHACCHGRRSDGGHLISAALSGVTLTAPSGAGVITQRQLGGRRWDFSGRRGRRPWPSDGVDPLAFNPFDVDENDAAAVAAILRSKRSANRS